MANIVLAHGAWSAAWAWKKMRPLLAEAGHQFYAPTYTGLGERAHLARPEVDLSTHIQDVVGVLETEDLKDVTLIGHSYGGMVATGVAEKARRRIAQIVYLDAFAPQDGQSLFDLVGPKTAESMRGKAMAEGGGWRIPPNPMPPDTAPEDVTWATPRRRSQPIKTFEQKVSIASKDAPPRHYVYALKSAPGDVFRQFGERAKSESGWTYHELNASHNPHITCPQELRDLLSKILADK
ncbi:MAG TPA: alpha/beta hydrolase [Reyranellaceae bacterium]|nr:alpha/beta hydrolase [Reyranellaceae bacterium]